MINKKLFTLLTISTLAVSSFTACNKNENNNNPGNIPENEEATPDTSLDNGDSSQVTTEDSSTTIANPWTESDPETIAFTYGYDIVLPEDATDVSYRELETQSLVAVNFTSNGVSYEYRIQPLAYFQNISGLYYDWTDKQDVSVSHCDAEYRTYLSDSEDDVKNLMWYDEVPGIMYCFTAIAPDLSNTDITDIANEIFIPVSQEADGDLPDTDVEDYFLGKFTSSNGTDDCELEITDNGDGTYNINFSVIRLCNLENGVGTYSDYVMSFEIIDPNGENMQGKIYRDSDNTLVVTFEESNWTYISSGDSFKGFTK